MRKDFWVLALLTVFIFALWYKALFNFFAQDDFILINQFSQNNFLQNIENVFGSPIVTHWRPIHNLYFFVSGNIFGKNYFGYHFITFAFHIGASFFIYKTVQKLTNDFKTALIAGLIYGAHSAHFISFFWISGGATTIGFFFLIGSIYCYLLKKPSVSLMLYILALLASEAMIVGIFLFYCINTLIQRKIVFNRSYLIQITIISLIFGIVRFFYLTPKVAFDIYRIELSTKIFPAVKYYLLRITGFAETSGDQINSWILFGWLIVIAMLLVKTWIKKQNVSYLILSIIIIIVGLFPFILIPQHLSPHYMNISIFGFAIIIGLALKQLKSITLIAFLIIFLVIAVYNINLTKNNNWVINRSNLARTYIEQIEVINPSSGTTLVFADNKLSTSKEAYIALGTGEAIKFWFKDKNYKGCFIFVESCNISDSFLVEH